MSERFEGYDPLVTVLHHALVQAAEGKGKQRHGGDLPFAQQPMAEITRDVGLGFPIGQSAKKSREAIGMVKRGEHDAAYRELLGAIVYLAGAALAVRDAAGAPGDAQSAAEGASGDFTPHTTGDDERPPHGPENGPCDATEDGR